MLLFDVSYQTLVFEEAHNLIVRRTSDYADFPAANCDSLPAYSTIEQGFDQQESFHGLDLLIEAACRQDTSHDASVLVEYEKSESSAEDSSNKLKRKRSSDAFDSFKQSSARTSDNESEDNEGSSQTKTSVIRRQRRNKQEILISIQVS